MARHRLLVEQLIDVLSTALTKIYRQKKMLFGHRVCHEAFTFQWSYYKTRKNLE